MNAEQEMQEFAPPFETLTLNDTDRRVIEPFFTNLDKPVFAVPFLPPEVIGALFSRTSRAKDDLRLVFLNEFVKPFLESNDEYGASLKALIDFLHEHPLEKIFSNPKGREFYIKWLAQYGDDSIAQMAGTHLAYASLSQIGIKHIEDMRIGIAPIEKSTRYVDYSSKVGGQYRYYRDPTLKTLGLEGEYIAATDNLFLTYASLGSRYLETLKRQYPEEKEPVLKTKSFDTVRGLLPSSTLSQVSFFGNGQSFEYLVSRSLNHRLGEIRWAGSAALEELKKVVPAFLRRTESDASALYRAYLGERGARVRKALKDIDWDPMPSDATAGVKLFEFDKDGEDKVIAGLLYPELRERFGVILEKVKKLTPEKKERILAEVLKDRTARWYKLPRAFENAHLRFELVLNIGAWRDIHRHRLQTQFRERWNIYHGFDVPPELEAAKLDAPFRGALERMNDVFKKIEAHDADLAQYATTLAHRLRFVQYQNLRAFAWEAELRTVAAGHPDYRKIEQQKMRLVREAYPLLGKYILADMDDHDFARRETAAQIEKKEQQLKEYFADQQKSSLFPKSE